MATLFFCIWTSQQQSPENVYAILMAHIPHTPWNKSRRHMKPVFSN